MIENLDQGRAVALERSESQLDLRRYLGIVLEYKGAILAMALMVALVGLYMALKAVPIYGSTAKLQIERQTGSGDFGQQLVGWYRNKEFYATQVELIRSWGVAEIAASKLGLLEDISMPSSLPTDDDGAFQWRNLMPELLRKEPRTLSATEIRSNLIASVQGSISVSPVEESQLVAVSILNTDPETAALRANTVAAAYIEFLKDKNLENLEIDQVWYASRLETARQALDVANQELQDYFERQDLFRRGAAEGGTTLQESRLQNALANQTTSRQQRSSLEGLVRDIGNARTGQGSLQEIAELESRGVVRSLKTDMITARQTVNRLEQRYGPKHPRMIEANSRLVDAQVAYDSELQDAADTVLADYRRAQTAERTYSAEVEQAKSEIRSLDRNLAEQQKLQDRVETARAIFEKLQSGEATVGMLGSGSQKPVVTIVEHARPIFTPVRPNKQRMVLIAGLLGLLLGIALAFLLDYLDNTFHAAGEVENHLVLPVLGSLPLLKVKKNEPLSPMMEFTRSSKSAFSESVRTIRTGAMLSGLDRDNSVLMVTSSVPGEGKTTLSLNLAHAIGHMHKTLLIDADMRRPKVAQAHGREKKRPGLSAYVTGEASLADCLNRVEGSKLDILASGVVPPNPLELLGSARFESALQEFREQYEFIIVDCAPALAVSDALVLSRLADAVLYVVKADSTPHEAAKQGVERLRRVDAPLLGAVLNQVSGRGRGYYGYGKYYRYGYNSGYYPEYYGDDDAG